jgi:Signal transduction histidine kinase
MPLRSLPAQGCFVVFATAASVLGHAAAAISFALSPAAPELPLRWSAQLYGLLAASALLSPLFAFRRDRPIGGVAFLAQLVVLFVTMQGMSARWGVELPLCAALAIEACCFPLAIALPCQLAVAAIGMRGLFGGDVWASVVAPAPVSERFAFAFAMALVSSLALICELACSRLDGRKEEVSRLDRSVVQLVDANMGFQRYAVAAGASSAERERKRISRDIHDTAVHSLVNIIMLAEAATDSVGSEARDSGAERLLAQIIEQAKDAVSETRGSLRELRDMGELALPGLAAIDRLVRVFSEATGVCVSVNYGNMALDPDPKIGEAIYRLVQEGLTNAFRHGAARSVDVNFWVSAAAGSPVLTLRVRDDGKGASSVAKGIGLSGMEERLRAVGGRIEASGLVDGFELRAWIPLRGEEG